MATKDSSGGRSEKNARSDARGRPSESDESGPKNPEKKKKRWLFYLMGGAGVFLLVAMTAAAGAYFGAEATPPPPPREDDEDTAVLEAESVRQYRGLDLAREKPLARRGDLETLARMDAGMTYPGRSTPHLREVPLSPEAERELSTSFHVRRPVDDRIDTTLRDVSWSLGSSGRLGGTESLSRPGIEALPPGDPAAASAEPVVPDIRPEPAETLGSMPASTLSAPTRYTGPDRDSRPRPRETGGEDAAEPRVDPPDDTPGDAPGRDEEVSQGRDR